MSHFSEIRAFFIGHTFLKLLLNVVFSLLDFGIFHQFLGFYLSGNSVSLQDSVLFELAKIDYFWNFQ